MMFHSTIANDWHILCRVHCQLQLVHMYCSRAGLVFYQCSSMDGNEIHTVENESWFYHIFHKNSVLVHAKTTTSYDTVENALMVIAYYYSE
jgi:hypothetical protein